MLSFCYSRFFLYNKCEISLFKCLPPLYIYRTKSRLTSHDNHRPTYLDPPLRQTRTAEVTSLTSFLVLNYADGNQLNQIKGKLYVPANIYAPNKDKERSDGVAPARKTPCFWGFFNIVFEFNVTELCHDVSFYQLSFRIKIFKKICNNSSQQELGPPVVRQE